MASAARFNFETFETRTADSFVDGKRFELAKMRLADS